MSETKEIEYVTSSTLRLVIQSIDRIKENMQELRPEFKDILVKFCEKTKGTLINSIKDFTLQGSWRDKNNESIIFFLSVSY